MNSKFRCCLIVLLLAGAAYGQNSKRPEFEVASVKISDPANVQTSYMPTLDVRPGGTLRISNRRLDEIIMVAYGIAGSQISGPRWLTELTTDPTKVTRYEIIAKVPENATKDQVPLMLQNGPPLRARKPSNRLQTMAIENINSHAVSGMRFRHAAAVL